MGTVLPKGSSLGRGPAVRGLRVPFSAASRSSHSWSSAARSLRTRRPDETSDEDLPTHRKFFVPETPSENLAEHLIVDDEPSTLDLVEHRLAVADLAEQPETDLDDDHHKPVDRDMVEAPSVDRKSTETRIVDREATESRSVDRDEVEDQSVDELDQQSQFKRLDLTSL